MFLLALLGCQALASDSNWKGEAYVESNIFEPPPSGPLWDLVFKRWQFTVLNLRVPKGTTFDEKGLVEWIQERCRMTIKSYQIKKTEVSGGVWIRGTADGRYISAYWHPTKSHTAGVYSSGRGIILPETTKIAEPGCWALAFGWASHPASFPVYRIIQ